MGTNEDLLTRTALRTLGVIPMNMYAQAELY